MVRFFFADVKSSFSERLRIKTFIKKIFKRERKSMNSINYIFCSDDYLLGINQRFLNHDDFTDIITFNLATTKTPVNGEIYISLERVKANANQLNISFREELLRVLFHGALHLCGYNDKKPADKIKMTLKEDFYLAMFHGEQ